MLAFGSTFVLVLWERRPREWPWDASSPTAGVLARENTSRNPGRTAVTSAALMIGVALIVFVAVFVNGFKDSFLGAIDRSITSDMIIQGQNFQSIPAPVVAGRRQGARRPDGQRHPVHGGQGSTTAAPTPSTASTPRPSRTSTSSTG